MDTIISDLHQHFRSLEGDCKLLASMLTMRTICEQNLVATIEELISAYPEAEDLTSSLFSELQHFRKVYETTFTKYMVPLDLLNIICKYELKGIFGEIQKSLPVNLKWGKMRSHVELPKALTSPGHTKAMVGKCHKSGR
ncbi:unnamed protein product [Ranitomeya imitator]|uniref:Uncharacterized protein n=1 Tax=Ranitomeya imitator TaxID=111125 RepID=A0ABN9LYA6_9NEOB|nr:unnamed protein product [Ranitomeya imitator]